MTTIELDDDLVAEIEQLAAIEHKTVKQVVNEYLRELIEDAEDLRDIEARKDEETTPFNVVLKELGYELHD